MPVARILRDVLHVYGLRAVESGGHNTCVAHRHADDVPPSETSSGERLRDRVKMQQGGVACVQKLGEGAPHGLTEPCEIARRRDLPERAGQAPGLLVLGPRSLKRILLGRTQRQKSLSRHT